jgi:hypothetical protein
MAAFFILRLLNYVTHETLVIVRMSGGIFYAVSIMRRLTCMHGLRMFHMEHVVIYYRTTMSQTVTA